jgi:hypothetical protein
MTHPTTDLQVLHDAKVALGVLCRDDFANKSKASRAISAWYLMDEHFLRNYPELNAHATANGVCKICGKSHD